MHFTAVSFNFLSSYENDKISSFADSLVNTGQLRKQINGVPIFSKWYIKRVRAWLGP